METIKKLTYFFAFFIPAFSVGIYAQGNTKDVNLSYSYNEEIEIIINTIENSNCIFFRNGEAYPSQKAASHLRLKLNRAKGRVQTTEQFITLLASKSSITRKPYYIACNEHPRVQANEWLFERLRSLRSYAHHTSTD